MIHQSNFLKVKGNKKISIYKPIQLYKLQIQKSEKTPEKMINFDITRSNIDIAQISQIGFLNFFVK